MVPLSSIIEWIRFIRCLVFVLSMISTIMSTPILFPFGTIPALIIIIILALIYGWLIGIRLSFKLFQVGPRKFFQINNEKYNLKPKILTDNRYGQHKFIQLKSIRLHYVENGNDNNQIMLFLHGFPEGWFSWHNQLEEFRNDFHVIALSLRGYGESDKPSGIASYSTNHLIDDIYQLTQKLLEQSSSKHKKIILVAHDFGGSFAWYFALLYPELIDKLIIMNAPHPKVFREQLKNDWQQFFCSWYMFFFQLPWLPEFLFRCNDYEFLTNLFRPYVRNEEELEVFKYYFRSYKDVQAPINYYRATLRGYGRNEMGKKFIDAKKTLSSLIEPPTLIIWGRKDTALVPALASGAQKMCQNAILRYLDDAAHWVQFEKPNEVNQLIRKFLNGSLKN